VSRAHQVLSAAGPYDAVTVQAEAWRRLLAEQGIAGEIFADAIDPRVEGVARLDQLEPEPDDLLILRYSAYAPRLRPLLELPQRKLLVHHNVTPPRYLWNHHPRVAVLCSLGRQQLPEFAQSVDVAVADSTYNARELEQAGARQVRVVPILFEPERHEARGEPPPGEGPLVLCVGRLVPNKRHDLVVQAFAAWQRAHAPDARLVCVGEPLSLPYLRRLREIAADSGASGISFAGGLSQPDLNAAYARANVLLSLSEHEGFCVPLLEAFQFGVPVVARPVGGMPEVGGDAVLWTDDPPVRGEGEPPDPAVVAELLELAVNDTELHAALARRAGARLVEFSRERTVKKVLSAVEGALTARASAPLA
jgi:L-malate glycosyltransferase